jgi:hypothetical protein
MALTVDDVITRITEASTTDEALAILVRIPRRTLEDVADQLYVDIWGKSLHTVRLACLAEARG